ncbi:hypothetical protein [Halolamina salifodinae]|uniref:Uncharacterized protein n=1 Tax=Halolamina salifodinae TaxID=1202767 RepID=A0A8T4GYB6_9EURY|nr:hypothetical protein [Halolamina salifodinae]MBP1987222.1 hypothetical protein [Halolamina salifodinae]
MGVFDTLRSLRPRLPQTSKEHLEMWAIDTGGGDRPLDECPFLFLVSPDGEKAKLLANRTGEHVEFEDIPLEEIRSDERLEHGDPEIKIRRFRTHDPGTDPPISPSDFERLPPAVRGRNLPPREFTDDDAEQMKQEL